MTEQPEPPDMDFEEVYRDRADGRGVPWDIGEPQPALAELVDMGWCRGRILDIGCGTGELGLALAARGHSVTGVDLASSAIARARHKAAERGLEVEFVVADATELGYDGSFDTVVDSGLLHCLRPSAQRRYLEVLGRICRPGGRVAVLCFADVPRARTPDRGRLTERGLQELFTDGWDVEALEAAEIVGLLGDGLGEMSAWPRDSKGRTPMTGWRLRAGRAEARPR
ncbi:class I SAM-dependent methyltransferase [Actinophytocola sp.]|uniref:class I SAM-dependent methyltransferase n=1 Tax=Actinophytocola sp. TaxID=1872138 RepID=UPI003D6C5D73